MGTSLTESGLVLSWADERIRAGDIAVIQRAVDGGEYTQLADALDATTGIYTDADVEAGHAYSYQVQIFRGEERVYRGSMDFVYAVSTFHGGESLTTTIGTNGTSVTVGLASPWLAAGEDCLTYTLPEGTAVRIEYSEQVCQSGLGYGAINNGDGTVTVTIGLPNESAILMAGDLFTVTAQSGAVCRKVGEEVFCMVGDDTLQLWHLGDIHAATLASYQGGKLTGAGVADGWNRACSVQTTETDSWKLFHTGENWLPISADQTISVS